MRIRCQDCDKQLKLRDSLAGKKIKCPACESVIQIPALARSRQAGEAGEKRRPPKDSPKRRRKTAASAASNGKARPTRKSKSPKRRRTKPRAEEFDDWDSDDGFEEQALPPRSRKKKKPAAKKNANRHSTDGFHKAGTGLRILAFVFVASAITGFFGFLIPWNRPDWFGSALLGAFNIASLIGSALCLFIPQKSGARGYLYAAIACNVAGSLCGVLGRLTTIPHLTYIMLAVALAGAVANLLFLRQLAAYVKRSDLVETAENLLKLLLVLVVVGPIAAFVPVIGPIGMLVTRIVSFYWTVTLLWDLGGDLLLTD